MTSERGDHAGVGFPPPFVFLGFTLLGPILDRALSWERMALSWPWRLTLALLLIGLGLAVVLAAIRGFGKAGTRPEPWQPSSALVTDGIYRHTRNPMYLGMALLALGLGFALGSVGSLLLLIPAVVAIDRFVIAREEAYLSRQFGGSYHAYCARVRRWW